MILVCVMSFGATHAAYNAMQVSEQYNARQIQNDINALQMQNAELEHKYDSISLMMQQHNEQSNKKIDSLTTTIVATEKAIKNNRSDMDKKQAKLQDNLNNVLLYGALALMGLVIVTLIIYLATKRQQKRNATAVNDMATAQQTIVKAQQALQEQQIALDSRLIELLERQLNSEAIIKDAIQEAKAVEPDHSLATAIAGEMTRIEQNLAFMDPATRGLSQLRNRSSAIFAALRNKGYEVPSLVGTEFKEGMNYETVMEEDKYMEPGIMRIKRVTQPCVMYNGKMIQPAKVVVAYNPEY